MAECTASVASRLRQAMDYRAYLHLPEVRGFCSLCLGGLGRVPIMGSIGDKGKLSLPANGVVFDC